VEGADFFSGGATNVLSRNALQRLGEGIRDRARDILHLGDTFADDLEIANTLRAVGVQPEDTRDPRERERFFVLGISDERTTRRAKDATYWCAIGPRPPPPHLRAFQLGILWRCTVVMAGGLGPGDLGTSSIPSTLPGKAPTVAPRAGSPPIVGRWLPGTRSCSASLSPLPLPVAVVCGSPMPLLADANPAEMVTLSELHEIGCEAAGLHPWNARWHSLAEHRPADDP
jgi:hypothetical protein